MLGILDVLAFRYSVYILDLRLISVVRRHALQDLFFFPNLRCFSLNGVKPFPIYPGRIEIIPITINCGRI